MLLSTTFQPNINLFPHGWEKFRDTIRDGSAQRDILLYKAFFSQSYDLFAKYAQVQSDKGCWYPAPEDSHNFFRDLFQQGLPLGMSSFETDFMSDHLLATPGLMNMSESLSQYLGGLAQAGLDTGTPMQWCMPTAGLVLFALDLPAVTNARASVDYACEGPLDMNTTWAPNYMISTPGLLFWAAGVTPSKDITWTVAKQPNTVPTCGSLHNNPNFELDVRLAVLSTGPVGLGDGPGHVNVSLAQSTCDHNGTILKPDKPLTSIDSTFYPTSTSPRSYVGFLPLTQQGNCSLHRPCAPTISQTHSQVPISNSLGTGTSNASISYNVMSIHVGSFSPQVGELYPTPTAHGAMWYWESRWTGCVNGSIVSDTCIRKFSWKALTDALPDLSSGPNRLSDDGSVAWRQYNFVNLIGDWVFLGDMSKIVPISTQLFASISLHSDCLSWTIRNPDERTITSIISPNQVYLEVANPSKTCKAGLCTICV